MAPIRKITDGIYLSVPLHEILISGKINSVVIERINSEFFSISYGVEEQPKSKYTMEYLDIDDIT
jgi:hypothetical protein